jgi:hypothetical protein
VKGSRFYPSYDDEPGTGGGVTSGVNRHEATWLSWSPNVFMEGRPVTRLTDKMLMNRGNTVSVGGYFTGNPEGHSVTLLNSFCDSACECKGKGNQKCVEQDLDRKFAGSRDQNNGVWPEATYAKQGKDWLLRRGPDGLPIQGDFHPDFWFTRPDITVLKDGKVSDIYELKFGPDGDRPYKDGTTQFSRYKAIALSNNARFKSIDIDEDCECDSNNKKKAQEKTSPAPQGHSAPSIRPMPPIMPMPGNRGGMGGQIPVFPGGRGGLLGSGGGGVRLQPKL